MLGNTDTTSVCGDRVGLTVFVAGLGVGRIVELGVLREEEDNFDGLIVEGMDGSEVGKVQITTESSGSGSRNKLGLLVVGVTLGDVVGSLDVGLELRLLVDGVTLGDIVGLLDVGLELRSLRQRDSGYFSFVLLILSSNSVHVAL